MGEVQQRIRRLVVKGRYVVSEHAVERLEERRILEWQIIDGIDRAKLIRERSRSKPNASVELMQELADGTEVRVVWSHIKSIDVAKVVTVYYVDEP